MSRMLLLCLAPLLAAQDAPRPVPPATSRAAQTQPASRPALDRAALEKRLAETLTGATLTGLWQHTDFATDGKPGKLGEPKPDTYSITAAAREDGDMWAINARMQFAEVDVTLPLRVRIVWAGDTPIITVDDLAVPGVGVYSARVMIVGQMYSGVWSGSHYGGVMSGQIIREAARD